MIDAYLDTLLNYLRVQFDNKTLPTIQLWGGNPDGSDLSMPAELPALLITVRGSWSTFKNLRAAGKKVRQLRMTAWIVVQGAKRDQRLVKAAGLGETLAQLLIEWHNNIPTPSCAIYPLTYAPVCENQSDATQVAQDLTVWRIDWMQDIEPQSSIITQQDDWLSVDISTTAKALATGVSSPVSKGHDLVITEDVKFSSI